ncbi:MAG: chromosome partitioning protein [Parcubacteria group bacterium Gr01-1014_2]|nr:MAG: chromosome partitioning protein [Parcubacteria group bacterium Gr01-1014_2]
MAKILGIINVKGGTGKTTTAIALGSYLAAFGKRTLIVDLDPQANASLGLGVRLDKDHYNLYHALVADAEPGALIKKTSIFNLDILPSSESLAGANIELVNFKNRELQLKKVLNKVKDNYDFILIDCLPSIGVLNVNALSASDYVLIPVQAEYFALSGLEQLLSIVDLVKKYLNPDLQILGTVVTMFDKRNQSDRNILNQVHKNFPGYIFNAVIPRQVSFAEAPSLGKSILQHDPYSKGARAYRELAIEVLSRVFPSPQ